jgi:hypothetical protein
MSPQLFHNRGNGGGPASGTVIPVHFRPLSYNHGPNILICLLSGYRGLPGIIIEPVFEVPELTEGPGRGLV